MNLFKDLPSKQKLFVIAISFFAFSLPYYPDWNSKVLITLVIVFFFTVKLDCKLFKELSFIKIVMITVAYLSLNMVLIGDGIHINQYNFLGLCVLFYLILFQSNIKVLTPILTSFIFGVFSLGLINVLYVLSQLPSNHFFIYNLWSNYSLFDIHKIYYAIYLNTAFVFILYFFDTKKIKLWILMFSILATFTLLLFTGAISGFIIFVVINTVFFSKQFYVKYYNMISCFALILPFTLLFLLSFGGAQNIFALIDGDGSRIRNYNLSKEIFLEAPMFGNGVGLELEILQDARDNNSWEFKKEYNSHNQYFHFLIGGGLFSLFLYLTLFVFILRKSFKKNSKYSIISIGFSIIVFYVFIIESVLVRHHGNMLFAFVLVLILFQENNIECQIKKLQQ